LPDHRDIHGRPAKLVLKQGEDRSPQISSSGAKNGKLQSLLTIIVIAKLLLPPALSMAKILQTRLQDFRLAGYA
jgi:hypothetical protein